MIECDHFIYTSAKTRDKEGYQIVAKSKGISKDIISEFAGYYYPIGTDIEKFDESRSLFFLKKNKIAYSIIKNIGIGYDARSGTLYNHTFIIDKDQFSKLNNDSRLFDEFYLKNTTMRGTLEKIRIPVVIKKIEFDVINKIEPFLLSKIFYSLFQGKKTAITEKNHFRLIQNILSILPPTIRLIPFSTLVSKPDRQTKFNFIQIDKKKTYLLKRNWKIIGLKNSKQSGNKSKNIQQDFEYVLKILNQSDEKELARIHREFEKLPGMDSFNKIRLLNYDNLSKKTSNLQKKAEYLYECAKSAHKLDSEMMSQYLDEVEYISKSVLDKKLQQKIKIGRIFHLIKNSLLKIELIEKILDKTPEENQRFRNVLLKNILKEKKKELPETGSKLLEDAINYNSPYKDDILEIFINEKFLQKYTVELMQRSKFFNRRLRQKTLRDLFRCSILKNPNFLPKLYDELFFEIESESMLEELKEVIHDSFSNRSFRDDVDVKIILEIIHNLLEKYTQMLNSFIEKKSKVRIFWNSDFEFKKFKHASYDLLRDLSNCLQYLQDFREKELNPKLRVVVVDEIKKIESILRLIKNIIYEERKTKESTTFFNPWKVWWPW